MTRPPLDSLVLNDYTTILRREFRGFEISHGRSAGVPQAGDNALFREMMEMEEYLDMGKLRKPNQRFRGKSGRVKLDGRF